MRGMYGHLVSRPEVAAWPLEVAQLLEEHHVEAWSRSAQARDRFAADLAETLAKFDDTHVCILDGSHVVDLPSFCIALQRALGGHAGGAEGEIDLTVDGDSGVVSALRRRPVTGDGGDGDGGGRPLKRRFLLWREAHVLLKHEPRLFGRLADAIVGVAAEGEFVSDDVLFLQRAVFVGAPALDVYAEDPRSQFNAWFVEADEAPLWRVITGLRGPSVARWRIGDDIAS